jgi:protein-L-isoaspartate(D-aspartate) O-methyltransferase
MTKFSDLRDDMVTYQIASRGVRSEKVLAAMRTVPREAFLPEHLREFAYEDSPLPIEADQTISQPYIVAYMVEALALEGGERILEIGTGSGYAAAVLAEVAAEVFTVERHAQLATLAKKRLAEQGYGNVQVLHGDGTLGWSEHAPFDGIVVTRITRVSETEFQAEDLADVRFVRLIGAEGWAPDDSGSRLDRPKRESDTDPDKTLKLEIANTCEPFNSVETANLDPLLDRIGDARVVLIGEATHGTSEFYKLRSRISAELIKKKDFRFIAIEGDWPDAARIDKYVRHFDLPPSEWTAIWPSIDASRFMGSISTVSTAQYDPF